MIPAESSAHPYEGGKSPLEVTITCDGKRKCAKRIELDFLPLHQAGIKWMA